MEDTLKLLTELTIKLHPQLGENNHTLKLIKILYESRSSLTSCDFFDLGRDYDRLIGIISEFTVEDKITYMTALMDMKNKCYGAFQMSSLK